MVAETAHGLVDAARERLTQREDPPDAPVLGAAEAPADDGLTVDPALTDGPFGDAPAAPPDPAEPAEKRPGRRRTAAAS